MTWKETTLMKAGKKWGWFVIWGGSRLVIWRGGKREVEVLWRFQLGSPKQHREHLGSNLMNSMNIQASEWQGEDSC